MKKDKPLKGAVSYKRVSTEEQGKSGVGLEGQQAAIQAYAQIGHYYIISEYSDIGSGRGLNNIQKRPGVLSAIEHAVKARVPIIVSGLDRLSREVQSIEQIVRDNELIIISADTGELSNAIVLASKAARAQKEGELISERTRRALQQKKADGALLGNRTNLPEAQKKGLSSRKRIASKTIRNIADVLTTLPETVTDRELVDTLNKQGIFTSRGNHWTIPAIRRPRRSAKELILQEISEQEDLTEAYKNNPLFGRF